MRSPLLWEWMVGLGILICVAGIFWPLTACACTSPTEAKHCMSNVKQMGTALHVYAADNNEMLPNRDNWMDANDPYLKSKDTVRDPAVKAISEYGYAFDSRASNKSLDKVENVSDHPLIFDSTNMARNASDPFTSLPRPGRHKGKNVVGYMDAHVRWVKSP
jgi:hypothetical protein